MQLHQPMHVKETVPAISASNPTQAIVVHRIHQSTPPITTGPELRIHRRAHIGFWVRSPSDTESVLVDAL